MKKLVLFLFYTFFLLLIGRQFEFLPSLENNKKSTTANLSADEIRDNVKAMTAEFEGNYSIYYEDLITREVFGLNHNNILTAASLNKIPVVFYMYSLADRREIDLEEKIKLLAEDIQDYGTGKLRYEKPGGVYTLKNLAELALQHSDNTAIHLLTIRLGEDNIQAYVDSLGLEATSIPFNETSPKNIGNLMSKFYNNELMGDALRNELMDYMSDTEFEDRIPRYLEDVIVYHKIGDADNMVHDGGIVDPSGASGQVNKTPFVLVVMTSGITDENIAHDNIGKIAKQIYDSR